MHVTNGLKIEMGSKRKYLDGSITSNSDKNRVWLLVKNGGEPVIDCRVVVEGLEFNFRDEWIVAPNGYERKALKWRKGKNPMDGKVDITTNGSRHVEIVKARRMPNPHFFITYSDGHSGKTHHFLGKYKLRLKIEAKIVSNDSEMDIQSSFYDVFFDYEGTLKINIKAIVNIAISDPA